MTATAKSLYRLVPVALLTAALAVAAAGCGNSESAQEKWANDVCTQIGNWQKTMTQLINGAKSAVQSPSSSTISTLQSDATQAANATNDLETNLKNVGPAPGDNGQTAEQTLNSFASSMTKTINAVKSTVNSLSTSTSVTQAATTLSNSAGQLSSLTSQTQTALNSVKETSSDLKSGFEDASACKDLKNGS
jgi:methyl-accepting chemotaxis protein